MKQELDKYFQAAKKLENLKNPLTNDEFDEILSKVELKDNSNYKFIAGGIMLLMFLSLIYFGLNYYIDEHQINDLSKPVAVSALQSSSTSTMSANEDTLKTTPSVQKTNELTSEVNAEDDGKIKTNPFRKEPREELIKGVTIGASGNNVDFLEPGTIQTDVEGKAIAGMLTLQLTREELAKIGVQLDDSKISFDFEYYHALHPIPFRNNNAYRLDPENKNIAEKNYPINGDTFLVKATHIIDLKYDADVSKMSELSNLIRSYRDIPTYDTINGKLHRNLKRVLLGTDNLVEVLDTVGGIVTKSYKRIFSDKARFDDNGPDYLEYYADWNSKYLQGYKVNIRNYEGWNTAQYNRTLPIIAAFKYNGTRHRYIEQRYSTPIRLDYLKGFDYSRLIPLELKFADSLLIEKLILWYYPTPELISLLPERYQKVLVNELSIISKLRRGELDLNSACELAEEETFFDICRFQSGAITINNIYPNPAYEPIVTLEFDLNETRDVEINLYDVHGNFFGRISQSQRIEKGSHIMKLNLGKLTTGLYIIGMQTDRNEFVSQRIVIN